MFVLPNGIAPGRSQILDHGRVVRRAIPCENFRAAGAGLASDVDNVLDGDRHAAQRQIDVDFVGFLQRGFEIDREVRVDFRFHLLDARS